MTARDITVRRGGHTILRQVSIAVEPGQILAIVGPNGSGKSSLLRALAGLWPIAEGTITIGNKPLSGFSRRELAQTVAFVPQDTRMDFAFTVEEMVAMGRHPRRGRFDRAGSADHAAIEQALLQCDIVHLRSRFVNTLSGGERQRVSIARSLAVQPAILLLDEPTSSLDIQHNIEVLDLSRALARAGKSIVLATHDLNAAARYADRILLLDQGRTAHSGPLTSQVVEQVFGVSAELLTSSSGQPVYLFHKKENS